VPASNRIDPRYSLPFGVLLSGALVALATTDLAPGWVGFAALLPLLAAIDAGLTPGRAVATGWLAGAALYGIGLAWAPLSGIRGIPLAVVGVYVLVLAASLACYCGALAWLRRRDRALCFALAPALWIALEYARSRGTLGYPWQQLGYALADYPALLPLASVGGVYALSLWMVALQSGAVALRARPPLALAWATVLFAAPLALVPAPAAQIANAELRIAAVQPHVLAPGRASDAVFRSNLGRLLELSEATRAGAPDLLVWPESAFERTLRRDSELLLDAIARQQAVPLLTGLWRRTPDGALYNAAALADPASGLLPAGHKVHPVPFWEGEPSAPIERALASVLPWPGGFRPGTRSEVVWLERADRPRLGLGVLICLDSSYPELARDLRRRGASLLVELSNESLTGAWSARQHARVSRLRALETGLSLVRVANAGPSEWTDASGRVRARLPAGASAAATVALPIASPAPPYVALGDAPSFAAGLLPALALTLLRRPHPARGRARSSPQTPSQEVLS
jgi:apolipoprotein N-acyltransferase